MNYYRTKVDPISGSKYSEVYPKARLIYEHIRSRTKRRPYIRSVYFGGQKIFLDYYWSDLWTKNWRDRLRRLKYYPCALDLLRNSKIDPEVKVNPAKRSEILYRFGGISPSGNRFYVQVKQNTRKGNRAFISVFPQD